MTDRLQRRLGIAAGAAAIVLSTLWIYGPALRGQWLWDDDLEISGNALLRDAGGWWRGWVAPSGMDYFPLKSTAQWLEWRLWGDRVIGYHLANVALHGVGALLLWRLFAKLFAGSRSGGAWAGAFLFAIHPVAVESVAWISEFKNVLSLPPLLLAAIAWVDSYRTEAGRARTAAQLRSLAWFVVAMLCKTTVVMFPAMLLLYAWWRRGRVGWGEARRTLPFFAVSLALGAVTLRFQEVHAIGLAGAMPGLGARFTQAGWSALSYLGAAVWPFRLSAEYLPAEAAWQLWAGWLALAVLLLGLLAAPWPWRRHALLGLGWFFGNLAPVLGLLPMAYLRIAPRADHLAYVPLAGIAGMAGAALAGKAIPRLRYALIGAAGLVLAWASHSYASAFRNSEALWTLALRRSPGAWLACNNLGRELLRQGRAEEAVPLLEEAAARGPISAEVLANLGAAYERLGRTADARAKYEAAIRADPGFAGAYFDLGEICLRLGEPRRAEEALRTAVRISPNSAAIRNDLGVALSRQGRFAEALNAFQAAQRLDPALADAWLNAGNALARLNRDEEALACYREALRLDPQNAAARHNLAAVERLGWH
jgi:tetratricopeptide (TPR) repeat protein